MKMNRTKQEENRRIMLTTMQALVYGGIEKYPVDLFSLVSPLPNLKLCSYREFAQKSRISVWETCKLLGSNFGTYVKHPSFQQHIIYYNDQIDNRGLLRFTLAHELAHFYLLHSQKMYSGEMSYHQTEREANTFARNLLAPMPVVRGVLNNDNLTYNNIKRLMDCFHISYHAAKIRLNSCKYDWEICQMVPGYLSYFDLYLNQYDGIII